MSELKNEQSLKTKCPACNASISFNPKLGLWKCDYCGSEFTLEEINKSNNANQTKEVKKEIPKDSYSKYISYKCESCGAEIIADEQTSATFCVYCGNTAILKSKLSGEFTPQKIIPFKTEKEQAIKAFQEISKGRPLCPKDFNNQSNIEKIRGIYIPFWLYDINIQGDINMKGTIVTSWSSGDRHYTKTSIYNLIRGGTMEFENIPVDGSSRFDNAIMNTIEPFDFKDMVQYNHAYLSGFYAEKYDEEGESIFKDAEERAKNSTIEAFKEKNTAGYTTTTITNNTLVTKELERKYVLLPVWMVNVKYKEKNYIFAMNGQTGEFIGDIPIDKKKAWIYSIIMFIILSLVIFIIILLSGIGG